MSKWFFGEDVFISWIGVVESRQDPLGIGRVQVRIFGLHSSSLTDIPSEDLPWASVIRRGHDFVLPIESQIVCGFFLDSVSRQLPIVWGQIDGYETNAPNTGLGFHDLRSQAIIALAPKIPVARQYNTDGSGITITEANTADPATLESLRHPNVNELDQPTISGITAYRNLANTVIAARKSNLDKNVLTANGYIWSEPYPAYNALYPYNDATVTESGHVIEYDDTPGNERIAIQHRTGTFIEMYPSGTVVEKVTKSKYQVIMADDFVHIMGDVNVTIGGDARIKVAGDVILEGGNNMRAAISGTMNVAVGGDFNVSANNFNIDVQEDITLISGGNHFVTSEGNINQLSQGSVLLTAQNDVEVSAGSNFDVQIGGTVNLDGSAESAQSGVSADVVAPGPIQTKKSGVPTLERVPVPLQGNLVEFDAETGTAYVQQQYLNKQPNGTYTLPSVAPVQPCTFDPSTKTFISDSSTWSISENGLAFIQTNEALAKVVSPGVITSYPDPITKGEPYTIGYGSTAVGIDQPVTLGQLISLATAQEYESYTLTKKIIPILKQYVTVALTQNMIDALCDFIYNVGSGNFQSSTLLKLLNQKMWCQVGDQFLIWNKAAGQIVPSLVNRRQKERSLFLS